MKVKYGTKFIVVKNGKTIAKGNVHQIFNTLLGYTEEYEKETKDLKEITRVKDIKIMKKLLPECNFLVCDYNGSVYQFDIEDTERNLIKEKKL